MHGQRPIVSRAQKRVSQQPPDRVVDVTSAHISVDCRERFEQLAGDLVGRQMRAHPDQPPRDRMLGDLLERHLPDRRDGVLIADRASGPEQLRAR